MKNKNGGGDACNSELALLQSLLDNFFFNYANYFIQIIQHLAVPETQDMIALAGKVSGAHLVVLILVFVLAAINFDNQFEARGVEIDNLVLDRMLAAKMNIIDLIFTKSFP